MHVTPARPRPDQSAGPGRFAGGPPSAGRAPGELVIAGAHGGAGATTLAVLLSPAWDLGVARRTSRGLPSIRTGGRPIVLVTRNTVPAAARATTAVNAITWPGVPIAVLAIVSDGLPEPPEARYRFRLLEARVGGIVRVPFLPQFRIADDPASAGLPRRARDALTRIRALAHNSYPMPSRRA